MSSDPGNATIPIRTALPGAAAWRPGTAAAVLVLLFLAGVFFTVGKIAVLSRNKTEMEKLTEEGDDKAKKLQSLTSETVHFLSVARTGAAVSAMLAAAVSADAFTEVLARRLSFLPFSPAAVRAVSFVLVIVLFICFWAVFGDMMPKKIALAHADSLSRRFLGAFSFFSRLFGPAAAFLSWCAAVLSRAFGTGRPAGGQTATEEEILLMMEAGRRGDLLNEDEQDMISNIFDFSDATVEEAMTHRTDVIAVEDTDSVADVVAVSVKYGYSRIPVYHEDLDHVTGIIYVKDLLPYVGRSVPAERRLRQIMRSAYFVPKSKPCGELFREMRLRKIQIAVVVDEYGGTEGIISMEDLLEAIVGNIQDEYDHEEEEIRREGENRFGVEGTAPVDEVSDMLGVDLPEGDYDTIAGLMMEHLGRLPKEDEHPQVRIGNLTLTVAAMEERRIARIIIEKDTPPSRETDPAAKGKRGRKHESG